MVSTVRLSLQPPFFSDLLGWPTRQIDPLGAATTMRYDRRGLVKSTTNRRAQRVDMTYDNLSRILSKTGANTTSDYFSYSSDGLITVAWNSVARDSMFHDPYSGSDSTVTWLESPSGAKRFRIYHSNNPDLATPDTMNVTSNTSVSFPQRYYTWDGTTGSLKSFAFAGQNALSMGYTAEQLRTPTTFPNSSGTRTESYTSLHGVIQSPFSAGNLNTSFYRGYEYDDLGRVKSVLGAGSGGTRWTYSYDNLGRLTSRNTDDLCVINSESPDFGLSIGCGNAVSSEAFSYDQVGNRTDLGGTTGTGNRIQSFNGISFTHDADGNVTQKYKAGSYNRQYYWSAEARLDSAAQDSWSKVKYDYDALGRPVRKWRGDPNTGWVFDRLWVYDGDHLLVGLDQNMNRIDEYAYAPGIDRPIATIRGNTGVDAVGYHVQDELGNIIGIVENGGAVSQTLSYDAWGTRTETGYAYNNRLAWKGLAWEGDVVSLYYMRNRWYDHETGRFMSEDPIGLEGGINLYAFAGNDPVNGQDPYGLCQYEYGYTYYRSTGQIKPGSYWSRLVPGTCARPGDRGSSWPRDGGDDPSWPMEGPGAAAAGGEQESPTRNSVCRRSRLPGTEAGDAAATYWAHLNNQAAPLSPNWLGTGAAGFAASLWTSTTADATTTTLVSAYAGRVFGPISPKGLPRPLARLRYWFRVDPPHHGKSWHLDGALMKRVKNFSPAITMGGSC